MAVLLEQIKGRLSEASRCSRLASVTVFFAAARWLREGWLAELVPLPAER
jgi:hypothetical protein